MIYTSRLLSGCDYCVSIDYAVQKENNHYNHHEHMLMHEKKTIQVQYYCLLAPDAGLHWTWNLSSLLEADVLLLATMMKENHIIIVTIRCVLLMRSNRSTDCYRFHSVIITDTTNTLCVAGNRQREIYLSHPDHSLT